LIKIEDTDKVKTTGAIMSGKEGKENLTFALYSVQAETKNREILGKGVCKHNLRPGHNR